MTSASFISSFILDNGITIGIFPGNVYIDIDSPTLDHTHVSHSHTFLLLSASGRYTMIIHRNMQRLHVTEYIPSYYKQMLQLLLEYRTLFLTSKQPLYLNPRYFSSVSTPIKELTSTSSSLWLIYTDENSIKTDGYGWRILAEDLLGHFLSICPFSLRLRLRWAKPVSTPLSNLTSSKSSAYFGIDYCEFEAMETIFSLDPSGPVISLVKSLYRHAYQNQFRTSAYHSITIPFYCEIRDATTSNDNLLECELKQLEETAPYLSTVEVHHQITSQSTGPQKKEDEFVGCIKLSNSFLTSQYWRIHDVDICYFSGNNSGRFENNDIVLHKMLPFIFPILSKDDFPLLQSMKENKESPIAVAWSSLDNSNSNNTDNEVQYVVLIWEELIQLYFSNKDTPVTPQDKLRSFSLHRDMIASFVTSQLTYAADDTDTSFLSNLPQTISDAMQWMSHWCKCKPSLTEALLFKRRTNANKINLNHNYQSEPVESVETIEGKNHTKFSVFYRQSNIYRIRALFRLHQTIVDFDISKNIFTCWLHNGSVHTFTRSQYEDVVSTQQHISEHDNHHVDLPVSPQLVVQLLACLRHCHQKITQHSSHADNGFLLQTLSEKQQAQAKEKLQEEQEMKRLAHERYLKRLCKATLHQTQVQEYFYRHVYTTAMGVIPTRIASDEISTNSVMVSTSRDVATQGTNKYGDNNRMSTNETADQRYLRERCEQQSRLAEEQEQYRWSVTQQAMCLQRVRDALQQCQELTRLTTETQTRLNLTKFKDRNIPTAGDTL